MLLRTVLSGAGCVLARMHLTLVCAFGVRKLCLASAFLILGWRKVLVLFDLAERFTFARIIVLKSRALNVYR